MADSECGLNLIESVGLRSGWQDPSLSEPGVGRELLVDGDGGAEVVYDFFLGTIIGTVAGRCQSADTSSVLLPFVPPEVLVVALVVLWKSVVWRMGIVSRGMYDLPIGSHGAEEVVGTERAQNVGDVGIFTMRVTVSIEAAVAVIWPEDHHISTLVHVCEVPGLCSAYHKPCSVHESVGWRMSVQFIRKSRFYLPQSVAKYPRTELTASCRQDS